MYVRISFFIGLESQSLDHSKENDQSRTNGLKFSSDSLTCLKFVPEFNLLRIWTLAFLYGSLFFSTVSDYLSPLFNSIP